MTHSTLLDSPLGPIYAEAGEKGICTLRFSQTSAGRDASALVRPALPTDLRELARQMEEYWAGARRAFDLPLDLRGTEFELRVWRAIAGVPFGQTRSYAEIARDAGAPRAFRAVGRAVGRNPVGLVVPCHRIVGSDGGLHGYGGGLERKRWLLEHEGHGAELFPEIPGLCAVR